MDKEEVLSGLILELRRGTIVLAVLAKLKQPMYGYSLVGILSQNGMATEANTLYPLLRRLEGQGLLSSSWETTGTKPRKYYRTTPLGDEVYLSLQKHWLSLIDSMASIMHKEES